MTGLAPQDFLVTFRGPVAIAEAIGLWGGLAVVLVIIVLAVSRLGGQPPRQRDAI
jgi:hypothetical protein